MAALKRPAIWLTGLVIICFLIELVLQLSDWGLISQTRLRGLAYEYGGFWPGLLVDWKPNYSSQPSAMFLTYAFLHSGFMHLLINMVTLMSLGHAVLDRVGERGMILLYAAATMGGAVGYALLETTYLPMIGASGALFGLAGGLLAWMYVDRFTHHEGLLPVAQAVILLILLNLVLWWAMDGQLAWETHLGGFVAGWIMALLIDPRPSDPPAHSGSETE